MNTKVIITAENQTGPGIAAVKSSMVGLGAAIGAVSSITTKFIDMMGEVARTTVALYKDQINLADSMDEMSTRMGMSIKDMTVWKAAAEMNGSSLESMSAGTRMLAKHMIEHGAALRKVGIDTTDTNKAFLQLSDLFKNMTDPVARIDLATRLFGRGLGQQLLPVLVQGSEVLKEVQEESGKYGEALQRLSPEAQKLNDTLYLMGVNFKQAAAEGVFPLVKSFNDEMLPALREVAKEGSILKTLWVGFGGAMKIGFADPWNQTLLGAKATLQQFMADVETMLAKITFGKVSELHLREAQRMSEAAKRTLAEAAGNSPKGPTAAPALMVPGANSDAEAAALAASLRNKGGSKGKAAAKTPLQKMLELGERNLAAAKAAEYVAADDDEEARLGANKRAMESARLQKQEADAANKRTEAIKDSIEPLRVLSREIAEVNRLRDAGLLSAEQASEAEDDLARKFAKQRESMLDLKKTGQDSFGGIKDTIESMGNKAADTFAELLVTGKASFSDLISSWLKDIARLQAKKMLDPITKGASDWLGNLFGGGSGGAGSMSGNGSVQGMSDFIFDLHSGGIAGSGEGSGRHLRNLAMFAGAPKYHGGGLAGDEVPAVLKRGEGVFTPGQMKALGGGAAAPVTVNVIEDSARGGQTQQRQGAGGSNVLDVFVSQIRSVVAGDIASGRGPIPAAMESTYGANRAAGAF